MRRGTHLQVPVRCCPCAGRVSSFTSPAHEIYVRIEAAGRLSELAGHEEAASRLLQGFLYDPAVDDYHKNSACEALYGPAELTINSCEEPPPY